MIFEILEHGFGLVLTEEDVPAIEHIAKTAAPRPFSEVQSQSAALEYSYDALRGKVPARYINEEKGGKGFIPAGRDKTLATEDKDMVVFYANKQPEAYKAVYRDEGEAIEEFRAKLGRYLPADYDYGAHIGYFRYCIYC